MKTITWVFIIAMFLCLNQKIYADNTNNPHNVSSDDWGVDGKACKICHPLQNSLTEIKYKPLWNNGVSSKNYLIYSSPTMNAFVNQPDGTTKLCLSCHDGTIASNDVGPDLSDDHPVSFEYNSTLAVLDKGLNDPVTTLSGLGGTIETDLLSSGKMQCTSCHNPHHTTYPKHLVMDNENSELCFRCHNK